MKSEDDIRSQDNTNTAANVLKHIHTNLPSCIRWCPAIARHLESLFSPSVWNHQLLFTEGKSIIGLIMNISCLYSSLRWCLSIAFTWRKWQLNLGGLAATNRSSCADGVMNKRNAAAAASCSPPEWYRGRQMDRGGRGGGYSMASYPKLCYPL